MSDGYVIVGVPEHEIEERCRLIRAVFRVTAEDREWMYNDQSGQCPPCAALSTAL